MFDDRTIKRMLDAGCQNCGVAWEWRGLLPVCPECNDIPESHAPVGGKRPVYIQPRLFKDPVIRTTPVFDDD